MGIVNFSIPRDLVLNFLKEKPISNFIETGTYKGATSFWAANYFPNVFTIEIDPDLSAAAAKNPLNKGNIEFLEGDSKEVLPKLINSKLSSSCLFWLDGHWCEGGGGKESECPLLEELNAISCLQDSVILIDDARCFLGPLPPPHESSHWPRIDQIFQKALELFPNHRITIQDDVIFILPLNYFRVFEKDWRENYFSRFVYGRKRTFWEKVKWKLKFF